MASWIQFSIDGVPAAPWQFQLFSDNVISRFEQAKRVAHVFAQNYNSALSAPLATTGYEIWFFQPGDVFPINTPGEFQEIVDWFEGAVVELVIRTGAASVSLSATTSEANSDTTSTSSLLTMKTATPPQDDSRASTSLSRPFALSSNAESPQFFDNMDAEMSFPTPPSTPTRVSPFGTATVPVTRSHVAEIRRSAEAMKGSLREALVGRGHGCLAPFAGHFVNLGYESIEGLQREGVETVIGQLERVCTVYGVQRGVLGYLIGH